MVCIRWNPSLRSWALHYLKKAFEKCSGKFCSDTVINTVIHETEHDLQGALSEPYDESRSDHTIYNEPVETQLTQANIKETL